MWSVIGFTGATAVLAAAPRGAEYAAHKRQIESDFAADKLGCEKQTDHDKRVCLIKAKGRENVALAELDYNVSGTEVDASRLAAVRGESDYAVARALCAGRPVAEKSRCLKDADAARTKAAGEARAGGAIRP